MSKEDLIPLGQPGNEEHDRKVRAKLKGSGSSKRKLAQQIRWIKQIPVDSVEDKATRLVQDENYSAIEIERLILEMLKRDIKSELRAKLIDTAIKAHQAIHGSRSKNVNLNIDNVGLWERMVEKANEELKDEQTAR